MHALQWSTRASRSLSAALSLFLVHLNTSCHLDLLPEEQAFLKKLVCGQGAGKPTSATRDKPEKALVLHTWGRGLSLVMAATGSRSLKTSPLCWGRHCGYKVLDQMLQLFTADWILPFSV